jgi:hypothetical protein
MNITIKLGKYHVEPEACKDMKNELLPTKNGAKQSSTKNGWWLRKGMYGSALIRDGYQ